jgi:hypothetical protein
MKVTNFHREKRNVSGSIFGICYIDSFFRMQFYLHHLYISNLKNPDFMPHIILKSKVRISLVHPIEENTGLQVELSFYRKFKRIDFSKLINSLKIYKFNIFNIV